MVGHWSDQYVGQPYIKEVADCAALAARVSEEVFGKTIGLPTSHATTLRAQTKQILDLQADFAKKIPAPRDGQPVLFYGRGRLCHIGIMCWLSGEWWVLHADQTCGFVVRQRLREITRLHYQTEGFYQWL